LPEWRCSVGPAQGYRTLTGIVHELVDIVSKNGNMVLNVPPKGMDSG